MHASPGSRTAMLAACSRSASHDPPPPCPYRRPARPGLHRRTRARVRRRRTGAVVGRPLRGVDAVQRARRHRRRLALPRPGPPAGDRLPRRQAERGPRRADGQRRGCGAPAPARIGRACADARGRGGRAPERRARVRRAVGRRRVDDRQRAQGSPGRAPPRRHHCLHRPHARPRTLGAGRVRPGASKRASRRPPSRRAAAWAAA